ncbi:SH3 domain-containing protein [Flavobacterium sp. GCM10027622]|uniref:SH3 domain-containing protein n=1 Tax=unclassified Flavobacterium TaxID=196869 RepID=UPI00360C91E2
MKIFRITQAYTKQYTNPILLNVGDVVFLGMEETEEKWKGWIWAELSDRSNAGWIPNQIIQFSENKKTGIIVKKYSAQELTVQKDEQVELLESLNGWSWVKNNVSQDEGWIPSECIAL